MPSLIKKSVDKNKFVTEKIDFVMRNCWLQCCHLSGFCVVPELSARERCERTVAVPQFSGD